MTDRPTAATVLGELGAIAPEADLETLPLDAPIRDELDIDSMDFLNFVVALGSRFEIDIPERDYPELETVAGCVGYLEKRVVRGEGPASR